MTVFGFEIPLGFLLLVPMALVCVFGIADQIIDAIGEWGRRRAIRNAPQTVAEYVAELAERAKP